MSDWSSGVCSSDLGRSRRRRRGSPCRAPSFLWRNRFDRQGMDALSRQVAERLVHNALAGDTVHSGKTRPFDGQAEMRLAAAVVAHMAMMARAVVTEGEIRVGKGCGEQAFRSEE